MDIKHVSVKQTTHDEFFWCNNGRFAEAEDSVAERALFKSDGPIAVFAATDVTHLYQWNRLSYSDFDTGLKPWVRPFIDRDKRGSQMMMTPYVLSNVYLSLFNWIKTKAEQTLHEHMDLYNFLGDPPQNSICRNIVSVRCDLRIKK